MKTRCDYCGKMVSVDLMTVFDHYTPSGQLVQKWACEPCLKIQETPYDDEHIFNIDDCKQF